MVPITLAAPENLNTRLPGDPWEGSDLLGDEAYYKGGRDHLEDAGLMCLMWLTARLAEGGLTKGSRATSGKVGGEGEGLELRP